MAFKKSFIISDESINTYGFSILTDGISLDNAKKNCPAFYDHRTWETPIGHWENLRIENGRLLGDLIIEGADEREKECIRKIENGDIKGASGGFDPIAWTEEEKLVKKGQTAPTLSACELFEASITPLPGNSNCLALKKGNSLVVLSDGKHNSIIPSLNNTKNMKKIALQLGLKDEATEAEICSAVTALQLNASNVEAMHAFINDQAAQQLESGPQLDLFTELTKTNFNQAIAFLSLHRSTGDTPVPNTAAGTTRIVKDLKVSDLVQQGKKLLSRNGEMQEEDRKHCFDYFQKKNPSELKRIRSEEPDRYKQLVAEYAKGKRYLD